jgi:NADPH2:quinone reductase
MSTPLMRCVEISQYGPPEVLRLVERPAPSPGPGEVRLRVTAAGVNRGDSVQRRGHYPPPPGASDLPGLEVSGFVETLGDGVSALKVGDAVCALLAGGGYADYCTVATEHCMPVPANVSLVDAAGLTETAFTVWSTVWNQARLAPRETLLVHGGASGIGTATIQMAAALGHRVFATAGGAERCTQCRALGAEVAIDYHSEDFVEQVLRATNGKGVDVILDMVGGDYVERELKAMAESGRIVFIAFLRGTEARIDIRTMMHKRISLIGSTLRSRSKEFKSAIAAELQREIWPLIEAGRIRPVIDQVFDLEDVVKAHERLDSGLQVGKILLRM